MKLEVLIEKLTKAKDIAYAWDRAWLEELEFLLLDLWLIMIDRYKIYKRLHHDIEAIKITDFARERAKHDSDLQATKALNKRYKKEIEERDAAYDAYKVILKYYEIFERYAKSLNSTFIHQMAMDKRTETLINSQDKNVKHKWPWTRGK